jgi:hypothetical protein
LKVSNPNAKLEAESIDEDFVLLRKSTLFLREIERTKTHTAVTKRDAEKRLHWWVVWRESYTGWVCTDVIQAKRRLSIDQES